MPHTRLLWSAKPNIHFVAWSQSQPSSSENSSVANDASKLSAANLEQEQQKIAAKNQIISQENSLNLTNNLHAELSRLEQESQALEQMLNAVKQDLAQSIQITRALQQENRSLEQEQSKLAAKKAQAAQTAQATSSAPNSSAPNSSAIGFTQDSQQSALSHMQASVQFSQEQAAPVVAYHEEMVGTSVNESYQPYQSKLNQGASTQTSQMAQMQNQMPAQMQPQMQRLSRQQNPQQAAWANAQNTQQVPPYLEPNQNAANYVEPNSAMTQTPNFREPQRANAMQQSNNYPAAPYAKQRQANQYAQAPRAQMQYNEQREAYQPYHRQDNIPSRQNYQGNGQYQRANNYNGSYPNNQNTQNYQARDNEFRAYNGANANNARGFNAARNQNNYHQLYVEQSQPNQQMQTQQYAGNQAAMPMVQSASNYGYNNNIRQTSYQQQSSYSNNSNEHYNQWNNNRASQGASSEPSRGTTYMPNNTPTSGQAARNNNFSEPRANYQSNFQQGGYNNAGNAGGKRYSNYQNANNYNNTQHRQSNEPNPYQVNQVTNTALRSGEPLAAANSWKGRKQREALALLEQEQAQKNQQAQQKQQVNNRVTNYQANNAAPTNNTERMVSLDSAFIFGGEKIYRPEAMVHVMFSNQVPYFQGMVDFLADNGISIAYHCQAFKYDPDDILIVTYDPPLDPNLPENEQNINTINLLNASKSDVWEFLKFTLLNKYGIDCDKLKRHK